MSVNDPFPDVMAGVEFDEFATTVVPSAATSVHVTLATAPTAPALTIVARGMRIACATVSPSDWEAPFGA